MAAAIRSAFAAGLNDLLMVTGALALAGALSALLLITGKASSRSEQRGRTAQTEPQASSPADEQAVAGRASPVRSV